MTRQQWLATARESQQVLRQLVSRYHPSSPERGDTQPLPITAQGAEAACEAFRQEIARDRRNPIERFDTALVAGDVSTLTALLDDTWLGVPESTDCWGLTGFRECVALMEDPPEEEEGQ